MRLVVAVLLLVASLLPAQDEARAKALLADLGADDPAKREAAFAALEKLGADDASGATERLIDAEGHSQDPEVVSRCHLLLDSIRWWDRYILVGGEKLGAVDLATGQFAWKRNGFGAAWAGARGRDGVAYLAPEQGGLECVELRTGKSKWRPEGAATGFVSSATRWVGHETSAVLSLSVLTGETAWRLALPDEVDSIRPPALVADDDAVFIATTKGLRALDARTGQERWQRDGQGFQRLRVTNGALYACAKYGGTPAYVRRIDRATGKDAWRVEVPTDLEPAPVIAWNDAKVALATSVPWGNQGWTYALDADTGKVLWSTNRTTVGAWADAGGARAWLASPPELRLVDVTTGEGTAIDKFERDAAVFLLDERRMLVADYDAISCGVGLRAYDASTGERLWTSNAQGLEVPHSEYYQRIRIERVGTRLCLVGETAGGTFIDVVDAETGKVTLTGIPK